MKGALLEALTGHGLWLPGLLYGVLAALIFVLGTQLARAADVIAAATGLGRAWIGAILLAASTSLPEVATGVNAALLDVPDIGVGDLVGATLANMLILALLDLVFARRRILQTVAVNHAVVGLLAIGLMSLAALSISHGGILRVGPVGIETLLVVVLYLVGMRFFYRLTHAEALHGAESPDAAQRGRGRAAMLRLLAAAAALAVVAPLLVVAAEAVAAESGFSTSLVGTVLVGLTTCLPEIAATIAAVRMGALDLAVGNIFGSNAFNVCVLLLMDLAYRGGPVLAHVSSAHVVTAQLAILAMAFGVMAIFGRLQQRAATTRFQSLLIVACYAAGVWLMAAAD